MISRVSIAGDFLYALGCVAAVVLVFSALFVAVLVVGKARHRRRVRRAVAAHAARMRVHRMPTDGWQHR